MPSGHPAVELHQQGYSPEGIAHELGIKPRSAERAIQRAGAKQGGGMPEPVKLSQEDAEALASALLACDEHERLAAAIREFAGRLVEANPLCADVQEFYAAARRLKTAASECAIALYSACNLLAQRGDSDA